MSSRIVTPRVSVITAFLNAERFLAEAIESVLNQTFEDYEYILVDDGSSDASTEIAKAYVARHSDRLRYTEHAGHRNLGLSPSRNAGIRLARGSHIALLDADDVWMPEKLAEQLRIMELHPEVSLVAGAACYWLSWAGGADRIVQSGHAQNRVISPPETSLRLYPVGVTTSPSPSDFLVRRDLVMRIGCFEESFTGSRSMFEDQAFLAKVYLEASVYFSDSVLLYYRQHAGSMSSTSAASGATNTAKRYFYEWVKNYIKDKPNVDPAVRAAYRDKRRAVRRSLARARFEKLVRPGRR